MCCVTCLCFHYMYSAEHSAGKWQVRKHGWWVGWSYWRWLYGLSLAWETRPLLLQCYWIILGFLSLLTGGISSCHVTAWKRGDSSLLYPTSELLITSWPPSLTLCPEIPDAVRTISWIVSFFPHNWLAFPVKMMSCHTQRAKVCPLPGTTMDRILGTVLGQHVTKKRQIIGSGGWQHLFLNQRERIVRTRTTKMVLVTQILILFGEVVTGDRGRGTGREREGRTEKCMIQSAIYHWQEDGRCFFFSAIYAFILDFPDSRSPGPSFYRVLCPLSAWSISQTPKAASLT